MRSKSKPDDNGLYPDEIAVLVLLETGDKRCKYPNRKYQLYPALLSDTSDVIDRLYQKKFIKYDIPGSGIKIAEWNVLQKYYKKFVTIRVGRVMQLNRNYQVKFRRKIENASSQKDRFALQN